jgi:hypothetical protein
MYQPVRYGQTEAWLFFEDKWQPIHPAEVAHDGRVLTEAKFRAMFPQLPSLPSATPA